MVVKLMSETCMGPCVEVVVGLLIKAQGDGVGAGGVLCGGACGILTEGVGGVCAGGEGCSGVGGVGDLGIGHVALEAGALMSLGRPGWQAS